MIGNEIKYLEAIRKNKNITLAASQLNISQPSLSRYLKDKEKEVGHDLFIRDKKSGIKDLTKFGKLYFKYADQIMEIEENYLSAKNDFSLGKKVIHVGMPLMFSNELVDLLVNIRHINKEYEIRIITDSLCYLKKQSELGLLDYTVISSFSNDKNDKIISSFDITPVVPLSIQEKLKNKITIDEKGYKHIKFKDLMDETFYIPCDCRVMGKAAREVFKKLGTPKNITEWDNSEFALAAAMKDNGIAFHSFKQSRRDVHIFIEETITCYIYFVKCNKSADDIKLPY